MGTPHIGSTIADWTMPLMCLGNVLHRANKDIVKVLRPGSEVLVNLQQEFPTMLEDYRRNHNKKIEISFFFEGLPVTGIRKVCSPADALSSITY